MMAKITQRYISKPFKEVNCLGLLYRVYTDLGVKVPKSFEDLTLKNYMQRFLEDPVKTQFALLRLAASVGTPSSIRYPKQWDMLVVFHDYRKSKSSVYPGFSPMIYVNKGQAIGSFLRTGVVTIQLDKHNRAIMARSLV